MIYNTNYKEAVMDMFSMPDLSEKIKEYLLRLVKVPSITGTTGEVVMPTTIVEIVKEMNYFQAHPELIQTHPIAHDSLSRSNVTALFKGKEDCRETIVLLSHFDVVGIDDFGTFSPYAFHPLEYTEILSSLEGMNLAPEVEADMNSGDWLFGRGVMDMKAGLAIQLALLDEYSELTHFEGNLLLLATPDEERNSAGMLSAVSVLHQLKEEHNLEYIACICSEPSFQQYAGDTNKYIYTGAVGKLLPLVFCVGKETHVGEPLEGLNASWMVSQFISNMELNEDFIEHFENELTPPPTCLKVEDLKYEYNVQTPIYSYVLYNILTMDKSPVDILKQVKKVAEQSASEITQRLKDRYQAYSPLHHTGYARLSPKVFEYEELYKRGVNEKGDIFKQSMDTIVKKGIEEQTDSRLICVQLANQLASFFIDEAPFYIILLAPPYYPHIRLNKELFRDRLLLETIEEVANYALTEMNEEVIIKQFFNGLSDVSYCRVSNPEKVLQALEGNMPVFNQGYYIPIQEIAQLNIPTINIGPYGKDAHKWTERLELNYSAKVTPQLIHRAIGLLFAKNKEGI